jgi:protein associated with RNAse G/E
MTQNHVIVHVLKYDKQPYRKWTGRITRREGSLIVLDAEFETDVAHDLFGFINRGTRTVEYYWLDRWYNVFRFLTDDGGTSLYYCNVSMPPALAADTLTYVDLDIDVLVQPDFTYRVLDMEEFEVNSARYGYSAEVKDNAESALRELTSLIASRQFPFQADVSRTSATTLLKRV